MIRTIKYSTSIKLTNLPAHPLVDELGTPWTEETNARYT